MNCLMQASVRRGNEMAACKMHHAHSNDSCVLGLLRAILTTDIYMIDSKIIGNICKKYNTRYIYYTNKYVHKRYTFVASENGYNIGRDRAVNNASNNARARGTKYKILMEYSSQIHDSRLTN